MSGGFPINPGLYVKAVEYNNLCDVYLDKIGDFPYAKYKAVRKKLLTHKSKGEITRSEWALLREDFGDEGVPFARFLGLLDGFRISEIGSSMNEWDFKRMKEMDKKNVDVEE